MGRVKVAALGLLLLPMLGASQAEGNTWSRWQRWRWTYWSNASTRSFWVNPEWSALKFDGPESPNEAPPAASLANWTPPIAPSLPTSLPAMVTATSPATAPPAPAPPAAGAAPIFWSSPPGSGSPTATNWQIPSQASLTPSVEADAFVNLGDGDFAQANILTTGNAQAWYQSPVVQRLYNGTPDAAQRAAFTQTVLQRAEAVYARSGVPVNLTADPNVSAAHTLSVVSNTAYPGNTQAIGISDLGRNGFSFIDKLDGARSVDELASAVAHNVAHEIMHTFGVEHHDTTGAYLDAAITPWETLVRSDVQFSPDAVTDLLAQDFRAMGGVINGTSAAMLEHSPACQCLTHQSQEILPTPIPEPGSLLLWAFPLAGVWALHRHRRQGRPTPQDA